MKWAGLWHRAASHSGFRCLYMVAWDELMQADRAGIVVGLQADGSFAIMEFFVRVDETGEIRQLVLDDQDVISGLPVEFELLGPAVVDASRNAMDQIFAVNDPMAWEREESLVLAADTARLLRPVSSSVLAGGITPDALMEQIVRAAGLVMTPLVEVGEVAAGLPAPQSVSSIVLEHTVAGLPAVPLAIEELSLEGPDESGAYLVHAGIRISNDTGYGWARVEATATLFNCAGTPLASDASLIDYCIPAGTNAVIRPSWPSLAAALLLNSPEKFHVVVTAVTYRKHTHEIGSGKIASHESLPVSLGKLSLPGSLACLGFDVIRREKDAEGNVCIDSRCVVQNLSAKTTDYVEYVLDLRNGRGDEFRASGAVSSLKPGLIWSLEDRTWLNERTVAGMTATGVLNVFVPAGYGCIQGQGATIGELDMFEDVTEVTPEIIEATESEPERNPSPAGGVTRTEMRAMWRERWRKGVSRFCHCARSQEGDKAGTGSLANLAGDTFYFQPDIPQEKLNGALKSYPDIAPAEVRMLIDDTLFGSASACLILTDEGIYANSGSEPVGMDLWEIQRVESEKALLGTVSALRINGEDFFFSGRVSKESMDTFAGLLERTRREVATASVR